MSSQQPWYERHFDSRKDCYSWIAQQGPGLLRGNTMLRSGFPPAILSCDSQGSLTVMTTDQHGQPFMMTYDSEEATKQCKL